jgi:hypothetical protein
VFAMPAGSDLLLLFIASMISGLMNAVAAGGSFVAFPALLLVGIPPISANVTTTVATVPGQFASVWASKSASRCSAPGSRSSSLSTALSG